MSTLKIIVLAVVIGVSCVGCRYFTNAVEYRMTLCVNTEKAEGMPLIAIDEPVTDVRVLMEALAETVPIEHGTLNYVPRVYCCQVFESNSVPAFITSIDVDLRIVQRVPCHKIFRTSYGFYAYPCELNMEDNPTGLNENFVTIVEKLFERCWDDEKL